MLSLAESSSSVTVVFFALACLARYPPPFFFWPALLSVPEPFELTEDLLLIVQDLLDSQEII